MATEAIPIEIWQGYHANRDAPTADRLVNHYQPLVAYVARLVGQNIPHYVDRDDLISYGNLGLLDAIDRYDPSRNVKFQTYAMTRIRGAIVDGLRAVDWVPRSVRALAREVDRAGVDLEARSGRPATIAEISAATGYTEGELSRLAQETTAANFVPLEVEVHGDNGSVPLSDFVPDHRVELPESAVLMDEVKRHMATGITELAEHLRIVITLYHFENLNFSAVAEALGVTESRVCQIYATGMLAIARMP